MGSSDRYGLSSCGSNLIIGLVLALAMLIGIVLLLITGAVDANGQGPIGDPWNPISPFPTPTPTPDIPLPCWTCEPPRGRAGTLTPEPESTVEALQARTIEIWSDPINRTVSTCGFDFNPNPEPHYDRFNLKWHVKWSGQRPAYAALWTAGPYTIVSQPPNYNEDLRFKIISITPYGLDLSYGDCTNIPRNVYDYRHCWADWIVRDWWWDAAEGGEAVYWTEFYALDNDGGGSTPDGRYGVRMWAAACYDADGCPDGRDDDNYLEVGVTNTYVSSCVWYRDWLPSLERYWFQEASQ